MTRGIPGEGSIAETAYGPVYRVPLPRPWPPGARRAPVRERKLPANWAKLRRADQEAWKREARAAILAAHAAATAPPAPPAETVGAYLARWLAELPGDLAPNTLANRRNVVERHLIPALGDAPLADLTPRQVEAMLRAIQQAGRAPSTVAEIRAVLVVALNDAVRLELIDRNPAGLARGPKRSKRDRPRLTPAQVARLVAAAEAERLGPLLLLAGALGLRRGELLGLRWADVDLDAARLTVAVQRQREPGRGMVERPPKAGSARTIPLPAVVAESLRAHRDRQRWERQQLGYRDHGLVFQGRDGRPSTPETAYRLRERVLARANAEAAPADRLPALRLHDLRGSAASILLALGVPLPTVMLILGHRKAATTLEHYAAAYDADLVDAAARLDRALSMGPSVGRASPT